MKIRKQILCPQRLRRIPGQFSWVDQRLVRDRYLQQCDHSALALYLVLVTVSDAEGLSYYSDGSLERMLKMEHGQLLSARRQLGQAGLIVYEKPLYQILSMELPLDAAGVAEPAPRVSQTMPIGDLLRKIMGGGGAA
jgi:hypothetical protein